MLNRICKMEPISLRNLKDKLVQNANYHKKKLFNRIARRYGQNNIILGGEIFDQFNLQSITGGSSTTSVINREQKLLKSITEVIQSVNLPPEYKLSVEIDEVDEITILVYSGDKDDENCHVAYLVAGEGDTIYKDRPNILIMSETYTKYRRKGFNNLLRALIIYAAQQSDLYVESSVENWISAYTLMKNYETSIRNQTLVEKVNKKLEKGARESESESESILPRVGNTSELKSILKDIRDASVKKSTMGTIYVPPTENNKKFAFDHIKNWKIRSVMGSVI